MKAFDKVPHKRLINKLSSYGLNQEIINWISAFLHNRKQRVCVNSETSSWRDVLSGIPQGSVLGPILFVLYINCLPAAATRGSKIYLFADDTKIYRKITSDSDCKELQQDIDSLYEWTDTSLLKFHPDKCKYMRIGPKHTSIPDHQYTLGPDKHPLEKTTSEKDIGVIFDSKLNFENHMNEKINKANSILAIIRRTFEYMDKHIFCTLYKSMVRPHLEYANQVWCPHLKKHIQSIENVQRRATKLVPGLKDLTYEDRLKALNLPTLAYRRMRGDAIEMYKILTGKYDQDVSNFINLNNQQITRGHHLKIKKERPRTIQRKYSFVNRTTNIWNSLPEYIISAPSVNSFERRLDKFWINLPIKYEYTSSAYEGPHNMGEPSDNEDPDLTPEAN